MVPIGGIEFSLLPCLWLLLSTADPSTPCPPNLGVGNTALLKKNEYFVWMNILDFKKMNFLFEWIFWIFIKWIIFWTNILVLVCPRQKLSSINVSKSSEIIQGSLMRPNSVHFRGSITYTQASEAIFWPSFGILNNFPQFFWMNIPIKYSGLYWMYILDFVWIEFWIESVLGMIQWKNEFSKRIG